jgi:hypothetical protein
MIRWNERALRIRATGTSVPAFGIVAPSGTGPGGGA